MALCGRQHEISAGEHTATVVEVGAGLRAYRVGGVDITCTYPEDALPAKGCGITLVPWPNRVRAGRYTFDGTDYQLALTEPAAGNAIHGLGRWSRWSRARGTGAEVTMRLDIVPTNGYPFELRAEVTYALDEATGLTTTLRARNTGRVRVPFGAGSHPYLSTRGRQLDEVTVQLPARERLLVDDAQIPTAIEPVTGTPYDLRRGRRLRDLRLDDGFTGLTTPGGRGSAEVRTRDGGARLWFDEAFGYLQVFTRENVTDGRHGVAIEPMTCAPDAFNSGAGLLVLEPGQTWSASWGITAI